ncbi:MAG: cell division protein FtsZ [Proteobacteria bacterium]|nr:cell division protein FtsZ [Pseudomonadota bacterium]
MTDHPPTATIEAQSGPRIVVVGLGGAGGNAVDNMIRSKLEGVEFLVANTDAQALELSACTRRVQLGRDVTRGLGAGSIPEVGRAATEESLGEILSAIAGAQMVFITAGMGGGTGTGGAPVIARGAREAGILTVGVVTKPFHFEGARRMRVAEAGLDELGKQVDTLIVIPNQNLFRVSDKKTTFADAFRIADEVLHSGVRGVTDLMVMPGLINLDFADIQAVMAEMGKAIMGTGESEGENRALEAAEAAISNPLLDEVSMQGARGVLINIAGGMDLTLFEVDQAANRIREEVDADANIIFGSVFDQRLEGRMRVSVVATGIDAEAQGERGAERGAERPKAAPLSLIVSRSFEDKPARQKAAQGPAERPAQLAPAQLTPEAPGAEATGPMAAGAAESVSILPGRGPEEAAKPEEVAKTVPFHSVPAPDHRPVEPPARGRDEPFGTAPALAASAPDAPAGDREVGAPDDPAVVEMRPASDSARESEPPFEAEPKPAPGLEADTAAAAQVGPTPEVKDAPTPDAPTPDAPTLDAPTLDAPTLDVGPGLAAASESRPRKRRSGGFFSWMAGRGSAGAEEHFERGDRHYYGQGVRKNLALALRSYRKAADLGHPAAQNRLGWMYEKGEGVEADYGAAAKCYRSAAEQGHVNAMNDLGYMYRQGWGVTQSHAEALRWFRKAAEKYDSYAEYNMGQMYENGWGVETNLEEGIRWFRRSAARGHEWAAKRLEELGVKT